MTQPVDSSTSTAWTAAADALWRDQNRWSRRANELAGKHRSWVGPLALLGLLGVVLSTLTPEILRSLGLTKDDASAMRIVVTLIGPVIVAGTAFLSRELIGPKTEQLWVRAREISEALKAEGFIYVTGAPPYGDPEAAPLALDAKLTQLTEDRAAFAPLPAVDEERVRKSRHPMNEEGYVVARVQSQISWHENDGQRYHKQLEHLRLGSLLLGLTSVVLGVLAGALDIASLNVWVAVVSTAIATLTSYAYASRYEFLASSYFDTAARLEKRLRTRRLEKHGGPEAFARFVLDCEAILAGQNRSWSQKLLKRPETTDASTPVSEPKDAPIAGPL